MCYSAHARTLIDACVCVCQRTFNVHYCRRNGHEQGFARALAGITILSVARSVTGGTKGLPAHKRACEQCRRKVRPKRVMGEGRWVISHWLYCARLDWTELK